MIRQGIARIDSIAAIAVALPIIKSSADLAKNSKGEMFDERLPA